MAGSFAEAAEAAQRVLSEAKRDAAPRDDQDDEGEDLTVAAAAVLLQARRFLGDSPAALRTLLESAFASLHAVPPEALLLWCAAQTLPPVVARAACAQRVCALPCTPCDCGASGARVTLLTAALLAGRASRLRPARRRLLAQRSSRRWPTVRSHVPLRRVTR